MSVKGEKNEPVPEDALSSDGEKSEGGEIQDEAVDNTEKYEAPEETLEDDLERHLSRKSTRKSTKLAVEKYPLMDLENGLVGWESQDDPLNPRNFPASRKKLILFLISSITFVAPLVSSVVAPATPFVNQAFHNTSQYFTTFVVSVFVLGFSVGPLFWSPLSEIYGRYIVLNVADIFFTAFNLGCALAPNLDALIVMRLLSGIGGSACLTIGSGMISDIYIPEQRGLAMAIYSVGILFGPILGPVLGGFIAQRAGWRWCFWVVFIVSAAITGALIVFNQETNPVVLIEKKTKRLRKELDRPELQNIYTHEKTTKHSPSAILLQGLIRPFKMLFRSPIVFLLSLYVAFVFGLLYLLFTTITGVYIQTYGWSPELCGLAFLGMGTGNFIGVIIVARTSDATIVRLAKRNKGVYEPEMRLPTTVFFGMLIPISFFWYGWATKAQVHWIVPIIGLIPFGTGLIGVLVPIQTYLIDAFPMYAASAIAAATTFRCLFGAVLPLAAPKMYDQLGLGWGNSLLGFIAVAMIPFPAFIFKYGGMIRKRWPIQL